MRFLTGEYIHLYLSDRQEVRPQHIILNPKKSEQKENPQLFARTTMSCNFRHLNEMDCSSMKTQLTISIWPGLFHPADVVDTSLAPCR
jgi:hypothetical protein